MAAPYPNVDGVIFKDVPGFPGYCGGDDGSAWSRRLRSGEIGTEWKRLKPEPVAHGYLRYTLSRDGKTTRILAHQLVLIIFVGPCPPGMQCRHLNGVNTDNRLVNLAWGTPSENRADQFDHGTALQGGTHPQAKLSDEGVAAIIDRLRTGERPKAIAPDFEITETLVRLIGQNKTRQSVPRNGYIYEGRFKRRTKAEMARDQNASIAPDDPSDIIPIEPLAREGSLRQL
jgi:hypothetical protein